MSRNAGKVRVLIRFRKRAWERLAAVRDAKWLSGLGLAVLYLSAVAVTYAIGIHMWRATQNVSDHIAIVGIGIAILFGLVTLGQLILGIRQTALAARQDDILLRRARLRLAMRSGNDDTIYCAIEEVAVAVVWWNVINDGTKTANSAAIVFYVEMEPAEYMDPTIADSEFRLNVVDNTHAFEHLGRVHVDGKPHLMFQHQIDKPIYPRIEREATGVGIRPMVIRAGRARILWQVVCDDGTFPEIGIGETHLEFYLPGSLRHRELQKLHRVPEDRLDVIG